jgi:type IV pilus assembly protein PilN
VAACGGHLRPGGPGDHGVLHYTAYTELTLAKTERDALKAEVEALKPFIAEQNRLEAERKALEALLAIRENLKKGFVPGRTT